MVCVGLHAHPVAFGAGKHVILVQREPAEVGRD